MVFEQPSELDPILRYKMHSWNDIGATNESTIFNLREIDGYSFLNSSRKRWSVIDDLTKVRSFDQIFFSFEILAPRVYRKAELSSTDNRALTSDAARLFGAKLEFAGARIIIGHGVSQSCYRSIESFRYVPVCIRRVHICDALLLHKISACTATDGGCGDN